MMNGIESMKFHRNIKNLWHLFICLKTRNWNDTIIWLQLSDYFCTFCKNYSTLEITSGLLPLSWSVSHKQQQQIYWIKWYLLVKFTFYMKAMSAFSWNVLVHCWKNMNIIWLVKFLICLTNISYCLAHLHDDLIRFSNER